MDKQTTINCGKQDSRVPESHAERELIIGNIEAFMAEKKALPPLSMEELQEMAREFRSRYALPDAWHDWIMVHINNTLWKGIVASVPFERKILLMPQCLHAEGKCLAGFDQFGLLCEKCHACSIGFLEEEAEKLGMMCVVAEGFTPVVGLIESGQIEAVIGVACLDSLERAFPLLVNHAIPGIAIPLNCNGCKGTTVDMQMVIRAMGLKESRVARPMDLDMIRNKVQSWFQPHSLDGLMGPVGHQTAQLARNCLTGEGKRWRPYLEAAVYMTLTGTTTPPPFVMQSAVAIECFHKASLVHDDIEDKDDFRYGAQTLHKAYGVPVALNVGDFLLGEGYRLIVNCQPDTATTDNESAFAAMQIRQALMKSATEAHCALCAGQGLELDWMSHPRIISLDEVLEIFRLKTSPAFEAAIDFGAIAARADTVLRSALKSYCTYLGVAYQLQDDLTDFSEGDRDHLRPSAVLAALFEIISPHESVALLQQRGASASLLADPALKPKVEQAIRRIKQMYEHYRKSTIRSLRDVENSDLKRFLFRVTGKILK